MIQLIRFTDHSNPPAFLAQIRDTFSTVFAKHYSKIMVDAVQAGDDEILKGFKDLIDKFFSGNISAFSESQISKKLKTLYYGAGIDDEIAFLVGLTLPKRSDLSEEQKQEISDYCSLLDKSGRKLQEVNCIALMDSRDKMHGLVIYHLFESQGQLILHIRQAAVLVKNKGYAGVIARYLADCYPNATYEANQRRSNHIVIKQLLINENLLSRIPPVLGYSDKYQGLLGCLPLRRMMFSHFAKSNPITETPHTPIKACAKKIGLNRTGIRDSWEAESIPSALFSPFTFFQESLQDDTYLEKKSMYLKQQKL